MNIVLRVILLILWVVIGSSISIKYDLTARLLYYVGSAICLYWVLYWVLRD